MDKILISSSKFGHLYLPFHKNPSTDFLISSTSISLVSNGFTFTSMPLSNLTVPFFKVIHAAIIQRWFSKTGIQVIAFNADQGVSPNIPDSMTVVMFYKINARDELCRTYFLNRVCYQDLGVLTFLLESVKVSEIPQWAVLCTHKFFLF